MDLAGLSGDITFDEDPYRAARGCDAVAILTEWKLYRELDWARIYAAMNRPSFIFDGRNLLDAPALHALGFNVYPVGKPALTHF
jgi:UDPglucose 6-dehydrogenase